MQSHSTPAPRKQPSGAAGRRRRVERGGPRYTDADIASRAKADAKRQLARDKQRWATFRARVDAIKLAAGCVDCGFKAHPAALDFDHLPGQPKRYNISRMFWLSWDALLTEIATCEVVCANCHRIRTVARLRLQPYAVD